MTRVNSLIAFSVVMVFLLTGCGGARHPLPTYEPPIARTNLQNVRTTAYTHTEADHLAYGNHNALGGTLRAAGPPVTTTAAVMSVSTSPADSDEDTGGFRRTAATSPHGQTWQEALASSNADANDATTRTETVTTTVMHPPAAVQTPIWPVTPTTRVVNGTPGEVGSAAADWSRWPAGTTFRIVSTGQVYRVDDYGWALAGRNTIDLYQPTRAAMNAWGVRREPIQILEWGDREASLRRLRNHQGYRHIRRMVLELEGHDHAAARLE